MTAAQLLAWFDQAAPGDRKLYYRGNLAVLRGNSQSPAARELIEVADAARSLGTPQIYEVRKNSQPWRAAKLGQGLAHLAQRRIAEDEYEYFITKARKVVVA